MTVVLVLVEVPTVKVAITLASAIARVRYAYD